MRNRLHDDARLIRLALAAELRNPGLRLLGAAGAVGAAAYAWSQGPAAATVAITLTLWGGRLYGVAACLWFAYYAIRDQSEGFGAALRATPMDGARRALTAWAAGLLVWVILLGLAFAAAAAAQLAHAGMSSLLSHGWGWLRAASMLAVAGTLSFALSRLMQTPLGGVIVMFGWFCAMAGLTHIPRYLQPDYAQNRVLYLTAALLLLFLVGVMLERGRRGEFRRPLGMALTAAGLLLLTGAAMGWTLQRDRAVHADTRTLWQQFGQQHLAMGERAPGFWLPDGKGGTVQTAEHEGKVLLIYLFAADDAEAGAVLRALDQIVAEYGGRGVQPLAVCISPNHGDAAALARTGRFGFPIGSDLSAVRTAPSPESAIAAAYDAQALPLLVVTDRRRQVRARVQDGALDLPRLRDLVADRLAEEPE